MKAEVTAYRMNPAEDTVIYGDELREGMYVLADEPSHRTPYGNDEDSRLRAQRFRKVTRLRSAEIPASYGSSVTLWFIGEWVDGYQQGHASSPGQHWIVKKSNDERRA